MRNNAELEEYARLMTLKASLLNAVQHIDRRCTQLSPPPATTPYDIALRPDPDNDDLMDDIVVKDVEMFRAEDMDGKNWWVACYLRGGERICWSVTAKSRPLRIEWVTTEYPSGDFVYERGQEESTLGQEGGKCD